MLKPDQMPLSAGGAPVAPLRRRMILALAVALGAVALVLPDPMLTMALATAAAAMALTAGFQMLRQMRQGRRQSDRAEAISRFIAHDITPSFLANTEGHIQAFNSAAEKHYPKAALGPLSAVFGEDLASPQAVLFRLQSRALAVGHAQEDIVTGAGHRRLIAQDIGTGHLVWRVEQIAERPPPRAPQEALSLPMLMVGRSNAILHMNDAARRLVGARVKALDRLFTELPLIPGSPTALSTTEGSQKVLPVEIDAGAGRRAIFVLPAPEEAPQLQQSWQAFQELPVPMIKVGADGIVQSYNRMAGKLVGDGLAEGAHLSELMEGLGRAITDWLADALDGRAARKTEFLRLTRNDREGFVQVVLNPVQEDGAPALIAVLHDATELKSLEAKFVQSQKMQAIGQLAGGVAHDFNNLLTAISGHCDLLLLRHDQGDSDYSDLVQISKNANRAAALVGQLLAFSRKQTLRPETVDMRDTLADLTHLLNRLVGEKIHLTLSHDPVLRPIRADKRQLEQVIMNLVVNARDAMPDGGEIRLRTEAVQLRKPLCRDQATVPPGEYLLVSVSDEGMGISADKISKVFQPFFTTKRTGEGTGLGLSTAYGIVKQSGGFIFVDSERGSGTTFSLYFPVIEAQAEQPPAEAKPALAQQPLPEGGVVLLVEDEAPVRAFASRALRLCGYTVLEADCAEAALKTLEDQSLNIDVFVTDVVMPGMDGPSWVREALKARPDVRVVFVSGYAGDSFDAAQDQIPNSVFLPKPFSLTDLTETVQRQLH